jgi:hypothetical protein
MNDEGLETSPSFVPGAGRTGVLTLLGGTYQTR